MHVKWTRNQLQSHSHSRGINQEKVINQCAHVQKTYASNRIVKSHLLRGCLLKPIKRENDILKPTDNGLKHIYYYDVCDLFLMYNTISRVLIDNKGFDFHAFFPEEWMACERS